ncbi:eukaryotic translation initiation factor 2 subunit 2-like isoform X1 [Mytilus galloprovincialis]|uniref:eukaryotic translation initiation factor 2 subunit 2-like isoform X1 n=1 Tax=Mytilus galloprovincialis TaxID=29158 RepID=UPI003F7BD870
MVYDREKTPFDPNMMKKKKKKKKVPFDLDAAMGDPEGATDGAPTQETTEEPEENKSENQREKVDDDMSLEFSLGMKKKKKKKKAFDLDDLGDALPESQTSESKEAPGDQDGGANDEAPEDEDFNLALPTKKKKKKKKVDFDALESEEPMMDEVDEAEEAKKEERLTGGSSGKSWLDSDRDYTYDELLTRVFDIIREKNPDMVTGEKKKFVMRPPQVLKVGTRKSSFANFADICRLLHRQPKHVLAFLLAELGTSGSVDGNNQLIIKGKYNQKQIENVLRRYIKEYVTCHTCRSPDTLLQKDTRLFFLQCETCGSRCSVASIKSGFQAVTGKRAAIRAKTT